MKSKSRKSAEKLSGHYADWDTCFSPVSTVGPRQLAVLAFVCSKKKRKAYLGEIAAFFDLHPSSARQSAVKLEARGLVRYWPDTGGFSGSFGLIATEYPIKKRRAT